MVISCDERKLFLQGVVIEPVASLYALLFFLRRLLFLSDIGRMSDRLSDRLNLTVSNSNAMAKTLRSAF
jgi:hypothetical protein